MINVDFFFNSLRQNNIDFFCGVPDSLLKNINKSNYILAVFYPKLLHGYVDFV